MESDKTEQLLSQLKDVEFVSFEASKIPGVGWWLLAAILLGLVIYYLVHKKNSTYRNEALELLNEAYQSQYALTAMNSVLKRTALYIYPNANVSALYGVQWLDFLNKTAKTEIFQASFVQQWEQLQFSKNPESYKDYFYQCAKLWLKKHKSIREATHV